MKPPINPVVNPTLIVSEVSNKVNSPPVSIPRSKAPRTLIRISDNGKEGNRASKYNWSRYRNIPPIAPKIATLNDLFNNGYQPF